MMMLAGVRAVRRCIEFDEHLSAISQTALKLPVMSVLYLNILFHQNSIVCVLSGNVLHKLAALYNPCWLANI